MLSNLSVVLPIFALILAGFMARRTGALGPNATREVNRLVVYLALPALLFDIMATADLAAVWRPGFIAAFSIGCAVVFGLTLMLRMRAGAPLADAAIDGLNASYANTGFVGFPLALAVIGAQAMAPTLVATILTVSVLFAVAIILIEIALQTGGSRRAIFARTGLSLVKNPLLIAPVLGLVFMCAGWTLPQPADAFLKLLGGAASPCALIALGLFLAGSAGQKPPQGAGVEWGLIAAKLIGQPLVTWGAAMALGLGAQEAFLVTLLSALPTGTGPFMLAEFYGRNGLLTGRVVLKTTLLSIVTIAALLALG
ncbi:auxin efflux carrier [Ketogulonicigenium vulgare Y25]|uniref:AEC family transporter n=2 Tax=Ketogulonicigenium vulgare TaxID=92945 RepID=UPI0001E655CB|nr:AEC family transporter [Ketogulonicigenium vulgare]ADO41227.1 auxin efflux carrier [Ketogulonicigenium vulgare Y25]AOZ53058.1 auxin efflux carrier [Ketogulonicigenium vulgare]